MLRGALTPSPAVWEHLASSLGSALSRPLVSSHFRSLCVDLSRLCTIDRFQLGLADTPSKPSDLARCMVEARTRLASLGSKNGSLLALSDAPIAQGEIIFHLPNERVLVMGGTPCHTDKPLKDPKSKKLKSNESSCFVESVASFVSLARSDAIVTQARWSSTSRRYFPPSGFSRFAAMYSLHSRQLWIARSSQGCKVMQDPGRVEQGNWLCGE